MKQNIKYRHLFSGIFPILFGCILLFSCNKPKGYKTESGLIFYVYDQHSADTTVKVGNVLKLHLKKFVNDSLVENTYHSVPKYEQVMPGMFYPYEAGEIYPFLHAGDSVVLHQDADTLLGRRLFYHVPSYVSQGDEIITHLKVVEVFPNDSTASADLNAEYPKAIERNRRNGEKRLRTYLESNNIDAELTPDTVFLERLIEGTGAEIQPGDLISMRFLVQTFSGDIIGDNTDPDTDPVEYEVNSGMMPPGIEQSLLRSKIGDHSRFYIPAMKAFGANPPPGIDGGFQDLIFEVQIISKIDSETTQ